MSSRNTASAGDGYVIKLMGRAFCGSASMRRARVTGGVMEVGLLRSPVPDHKVQENNRGSVESGAVAGMPVQQCVVGLERGPVRESVRRRATGYGRA